MNLSNTSPTDSKNAEASVVKVDNDLLFKVVSYQFCIVVFKQTHLCFPFRNKEDNPIEETQIDKCLIKVEHDKVYLPRVGTRSAPMLNMTTSGSTLDTIVGTIAPIVLRKLGIVWLFCTGALQRTTWTRPKQMAISRAQ